MEFLRQQLIRLLSKIHPDYHDIEESDLQSILIEGGIGYLIFAIVLHPLFLSPSILGRLVVYLPSFIVFTVLAFIYLPKRDQMNIYLDRDSNEFRCFVGGVDRKPIHQPLDSIWKVKVEQRKEYKTVSRTLPYGATQQVKAWVQEYRLVFCFKNRCDIPWVPWMTPAFPLTARRLNAIDRKINRFISQSKRPHLTIIGDPLHGLFGIFSIIAIIFGCLSLINLLKLFS